jgi:hypothetical protein
MRIGGHMHAISRGRCARRILALSPALLVGAAHAAPEEIQVYLDDLTPPGHVGLDLHNNYVIDGSGTPDYAGARPPDRVYRLTPEFYVGLSPRLELGVYVLTAIDRRSASTVDGEKIRLKYVAAHDEKEGAFWGINVEAGRSALAVAERPWNYELKGILGRRSGPWTLAFNVNVDAALSAHGGSTMLDVDTRLSYEVHAATQVGLEAYNELGPVSGIGALHDRSEMLFAVIDADLKAFDLGAGVGRGLTAASDRWVVKVILGFRF